MAEIRAFRGYRYDMGKAGALSDVVAPPYDVVDAALQQKLYDASPYNAIRLELTRDEPGDGDTSNKYSRASQTMREWQDDAAVTQDTHRCLYVCEQEFTVEGKTYRRRGFMARVRLEPFGTGRIFPHEQTLSGPKEDRLKLFRATGFNLSPIFGLYPDPDNEVFARFETYIRKHLPLEAVDHLGVKSRLWPVHDETIVTQVCSQMTPHPIFIADGHHRYETGLKYFEERQAAPDAPGTESAAAFCMMMLVSMSDPGLIILPTHRLVGGFPGLTSPMLQDRLGRYFDIDIVGNGPTAAQDTWDRIEIDDSQAILGFQTQADGIWLFANLRTPEIMAELAGDHSDDWQSLGVSILHVLVLEKLLSDCGTPKCRYVHLLSEVETAIAAGEPSLSCLVPSATMYHVESIAGEREKMPPKSTYFYPKLLTGLVFNSLRGH